MPNPRLNRRPTFAWQATLILLPVVALVGFGLLAIRRDYAAVEQGAQRQAEEIARDLAARLPNPVGRERYGRRAGIPLGPGTFDLWAAHGRQLAERQRMDPGQRLAEAMLTPVIVSRSGELVWPADYPVVPGPAVWLDELTPEQDQLWRRAEAAECVPGATGEARAAFQAFLESQPPGDAATNAQLSLLFLDPEALSDAGGGAADSPRYSRTFVRQSIRSRLGESNQRADRLVRFARGSDGILSESGLPLSAVALTRAFREAETTGLNTTLVEELARQVSNVPCLLTPQLLDAAERLAAAPPPETRRAVEALRDLWTRQERLRALTRRARSLLPAPRVTGTNFWMDADTQRWRVQVNPASEPTSTPTDQPAPVAGAPGEPERVVRPPTSRLIEVRFLPKSAVEWVARRDLAQAGVTLPDYFAVRLSLDGEPLDTTAPNGTAGSLRGRVAAGGPTNQVPRILARSESHPRSATRPSPEAPSAATSDLSADPRVRLEIALELIDPPRLYAQARQRALLFGGLILAAAATSLVGLVTARRAFLRQLRLNELKSNFVSSVSHELRAPIASVRLLAESLERGKVTEPARQAEYFRLIVQECRRLGALIANVLDFSRIDQGRRHYEFVPTDLVALVRQTVQLMEPYATERQVTLALCGIDPQPSTPNPQPLLDGRALQQALVNLLDNALKHAPAGSTVTVGLETEGGGPNAEPGTRNAERGTGSAERGTRRAEPGSHRTEDSKHSSRVTRHSPLLTLWVEDSGPGIPVEDHARIFEPFYRRGSELRRETPGIGIGLTIVKHVVQAHGGQVNVRSAVGQGSRFTIELPVNPNPTGPDPAEPNHAPA